MSHRNEALLACVAASLFYVALYGELPYHDAARFAAQINSGAFVWDIGHIFMQPVTLLWHRYLGFGETAELSQKHINSFATAVAVGIFHYTLIRLDVALLRRVACSLLLAASCSVITLAPSGHMKLLAFPFVNASLCLLILWEKDNLRAGLLVGSAIFLGLAGAFLASALATVPFAAIAVLIIFWREHQPTEAAAKMILFGAVCTLVFGISAVFGYVTFAGEPLTIAGLQHSVSVKANLRPAGTAPSLSLSSLARLVFGTVNNFVAAPNLGSDVRAFLGGQIKDIHPYFSLLIWQVIPFVATLGLLAVVYVSAARSLVRGSILWAPLAFLCGAQAWTIYYGLNDPEHWFQLSAPTIILYLQTLPQAFVGWTLPLWAAGTLAVNLALYAIPQAAYPLHRYERQLAGMYSDADLLVYFVTYPGTHYLGFFELPHERRVAVDAVFKESKDQEQAFTRLRDDIRATLDAGGKVTIYSILDPYDWNGGWAVLADMKVTKARLTRFFQDNFKVEYAGEVAEMPTWNVAKP